MCEFVPTENPAPSDSAIPKPLRETLKARRVAVTTLQTSLARHGITPRVFDLIDRVSDLNRSLQRREWLLRVDGFDPIALGM